MPSETMSVVAPAGGVGAQQNHQRAGGRERKRGGKNPRPVDSGMHAKGHVGGAGKGVCGIAADEADGVARIALRGLEFSASGAMKRR